MKTLTIIDTFGLFFRLYYAMSGLRTKDGKPSGMVNGFATFINQLKSEFSSDYIVFALDSKGKTFRSQIDENYKSNRQAPPQALLEQLPVCIDMIDKMGLCSLCKEGYEADDIIASYVKSLQDQDVKIHIVTHDKDLYQLINDHVSIYSPSKKELYGRDGCFEKYGVYPEQIIDYLAICGDSSDNIPGVKGIGEKGAKKLLDEFGTLENIYNNITNVRNERTKELLISGKQSAFMSKQLATLYNELEILPLEYANFPSQNPLLKVTELLKEYSLNKILTTLSIKPEPPKLNFLFKDICVLDELELARICDEINGNTIVSFDTETTGVQRGAKIVGFSFCLNENEAYYVPLTHSYLGAPTQISLKSATSAITKIFQGFVIGQNLKFDFRIVEDNLGIKPPSRYADTMVMAWLMDPSDGVGMDAIAWRLYGYETIKFEDMVKKGETFASVDIATASRYGAQDAWITLKFYHSYVNLLEPNLQDIAAKLEFPFIKVLGAMEKEGIKINRDKIRLMIESNSKTIRSLTAEIYELSGEKFNINSPKQLGSVLFERLNLTCPKKTKTGYSTDESVLLELLNSHAVIPKLLEYREIYKLQSTYCEPLLALALSDEQSRVYTSFLQTGTATGRLSSKNPNLQNIPARGENAKAMRECFEAKDGNVLISLDYSQIELRLLAHFSQDAALVEAFKNGEDIHEKTAISIFSSCDTTKRAIAKSINFGLIYGMGASKLSSQIKISRTEAKEYITRYFAAFPTIKEFLDTLKTKALHDGYITTLLGRKRYFDFSRATPMQAASYEREAVNTKFQGSAADIIKTAMVKIYPLLNENAKMLLQIHDELIFEVKEEMSQSFALNVQKIMQEVIKLNVPLKTSCFVAQNWGELK